MKPLIGVTCKYSYDGIIEAIEYHECDVYTIGVQWHLECLVDKYQEHLNIFKSFINSIKK